jgi:hypothetical protein
MYCDTTPVEESGKMGHIQEIGSHTIIWECKKMSQSMNDYHREVYLITSCYWDSNQCVFNLHKSTISSVSKRHISSREHYSLGRARLKWKSSKKLCVFWNIEVTVIKEKVQLTSYDYKASQKYAFYLYLPVLW